MRNLTKQMVVAVGMLTLTVSGASAADPDVQLMAKLDPAQEVPPKTSSGSGTFTGTYKPATHELNYTVSYSGLTGPATMAHLHGPAAVGANAGVIVPFTVTPDKITGTATLTEAQAADLMAGKWYANIHTAANPGGEIRGQVTH